MSNHRTPTTSKHSHLPPTFANKDGQHRATPCSMPQQPAFSNVMHLFLAQFEDDVKHQCLHQQETPPPLNSSDSSRAHSPSRSSANQIQQSIRTGREALLEIDNASPRPHTWITTMVGYDTGSKCTWLTLVKAIPQTLTEAVAHRMQSPAYKMWRWMNSAATPHAAADTDSVSLMQSTKDNPDQYNFRPLQTLVKGRPGGTGLNSLDSTFFDTETSMSDDSSDRLWSNASNSDTDVHLRWRQSGGDAVD